MKNLHSKHDTLPKTTVSLAHDKAYRCSAQMFFLYAASLSHSLFSQSFNAQWNAPKIWLDTHVHHLVSYMNVFAAKTPDY